MPSGGFGAVAFAHGMRMTSNSSISKEERIARAKEQEEREAQKRKWDNRKIAVRKLIRAGDVGEFIKISESDRSATDAVLDNDSTTWPTTLQLAVLSKSPEMVSHIVSKKDVDGINYSNEGWDFSVREPYTVEELNLCRQKTARSVADALLKTASEDDKANLKKIKSILIQNGAKQKTRLGFTVFPENAENVKIYKAKQKTLKQGGTRARKTRSQSRNRSRSSRYF